MYIPILYLVFKRKAVVIDINKLVSIIIPTYNRTFTLERAINSCLKQTYDNIEILVIDDNQPDSHSRMSTETIMVKYSKEDKVLYIKRKTNGGGALARNTGIEMAQGDYVTFLDDDDEYLPNKIKEQVRLIEKGFDMIFSDIEIINVDTNERQIQKYKKDFTLDYKGLLTKHLIDVISGTPTFMFTTNALKRIGGFENINANQEYILMLKAITQHLNIGYLDKVLCRAYVDNADITRISNSDKIIQAKIDVIRRIKPYLSDLERSDQRKAMYRLNAFVFYQSLRRRKITAILYGIKLIPYLDLLILNERNKQKKGAVIYK